MEIKSNLNQKIAPCLWFNNNAEEAVNFYKSVFKDVKINKVVRNGKNMPMPEGTVLTVQFQMCGQNFLALNGGPAFKFTEAISLMVNCDDQKEIDYLWEKLSDGGQIQECGWLKDKYGLSWQIIPSSLFNMFESGSQEQVDRLMQAVMKLVKLDKKKMEDAFFGREVMQKQ